MKLVLLFGDGAVGKMTVGQELMKITDLRLFHNHMSIEPVVEVFGHFNGNAIRRMREVFFEEFAQTDNYGMIFTYMWAFSEKSDWDYVEHVKEIFLQHKPDTEFYYVELIAPQEVRLQRNETENRLKNKPTKRNIERSRAMILGDNRTMRLVSEPGEIPYANYLRIENADIPAAEAAKMIKARFDL
ncbi:MAG: AAA family ATPase [Clostridia bacterium]|nr:AAA family ATPase [Clostridia bacterium]